MQKNGHLCDFLIESYNLHMFFGGTSGYFLQLFMLAV